MSAITITLVNGTDYVIVTDQIVYVAPYGSGSIVVVNTQASPIEVADTPSAISILAANLVEATIANGDSIYFNPTYVSSISDYSAVNVSSQVFLSFSQGPAGSFVNKIFLVLETSTALETAINALSPGGGSDPFTSDFTVSLSGGKTFGKYTTGQVVPSNGLTARQVILLAAIEDIAPTYTIPTMTLGESEPTLAEVGTAYNNTLTATFTQNDAGALTNIRIQKNGADIVPNGAVSPWVKADTGSYVLGNISYIAYSDYSAGIIKNYTPSGTPDPRPPLVRSANAPQAASTNFASSTVLLTGSYKQFYGPTAVNSTTSALVRALPSNRFVSAGNSFSMNSGTSLLIFEVWLPSGKTLSAVFDATAGFDITASWLNIGALNVNDAGGTPVAGNLWRMTVALAYASNHVFNITLV